MFLKLNKPILTENENDFNIETKLNYNIYNKNIDYNLFDDKNNFILKLNHKSIKNIPSIATIKRSTNNRFIEVCLFILFLFNRIINKLGLRA